MLAVRKNPVEVARARRQELARAARGVEQAAEEELAALRRELAEHVKAVEQSRAEWQAYTRRSGDNRPLAAFPSPMAGADRLNRTTALESNIGAAERKLRDAQDRANDAERLARPLSAAALQRLQELANAVAADAELAALGIWVPTLNHDAILESAREFGITPGGD